jgi:hypothetical protein
MGDGSLKEFGYKKHQENVQLNFQVGNLVLVDYTTSSDCRTSKVFLFVYLHRHGPSTHRPRLSNNLHSIAQAST